MSSGSPPASPILLDAIALRGILLPASMRLLREHSWYAPRLALRLDTELRLTEASRHT